MAIKIFKKIKKAVKSKVKAHQRAVAKKAAKRSRAEDVRIQQQRVKALGERARLMNKREMLEARLAVVREQEAVKRIRHAAGDYTLGERTSKTLHKSARGASITVGAFSRGLAGTARVAGRAAVKAKRRYDRS